MAVQQGELAATDTTKNMENFYNDAVVTEVLDVDRIIHNATQFVRLVLQRPQPTTAEGGSTGSPDNLTSNSVYIDGQFIANPTSGVNLIRVGFAAGQLVETTKITVYTIQPIDTTPANWDVATSLDGTDAQFVLANFRATSLSIVETPVTLDSVSQFKYEISFTAPAIGGLRFWRVTHTTAGKFNDVTEVEIVDSLTPTLSYFNTDGSFASSFPFEKPDILDACFDVPTDVFYTIRFNSENVGTTSLDLSDDFSEGEAGTASGTNTFNTARWAENSINSQFLRVSEQLSYNVAAGKGQLETTYALGGDFEVELFVDPQTLTTENMWLVLRALDVDNKVVASEGVGLETSPTTSGVYFTSYISTFVNSTASCTFKEARPLWHNTPSGTDSFAITFDGSNWNVSGTLTGGLADATTGVIYDESTESATPLEFLISCTASPSVGEKFTFDLITDNVKKGPLATGTIGVTRSGSFQTTKQVLLATGTSSITTDDLNIELFGNTNGVVKILADDYEVVTGSGVFPNIAVFTIEKTDAEGDLVGTPLIESFDVIGDSSKTYNDFLDGRVQIACSSSGTSGGGHIYVKVDNVLYKYLNNVALSSDDGSSAVVSTTAQIAKDGTNSFSWTFESGVSVGTPFLTYVEHDDPLDITHLKTINKDTLLSTTDSKQILLDIDNYETNQFRVFYDQNDFDTLYFVDGPTNLQAFNLDDRISAFMAVNAEDVTLPAGTAQSTDVNADVINAWGEFLDGKVVTFAVTAGDGAVTPSSDTTISGGRATTQFTVGSTVGVSTVTATVTEA